MLDDACLVCCGTALTPRLRVWSASCVLPSATLSARRRAHVYAAETQSSDAAYHRPRGTGGGGVNLPTAREERRREGGNGAGVQTRVTDVALCVSVQARAREGEREEENAREEKRRNGRRPAWMETLSNGEVLGAFFPS